MAVLSLANNTMPLMAMVKGSRVVKEMMVVETGCKCRNQWTGSIYVLRVNGCIVRTQAGNLRGFTGFSAPGPHVV